MLMHFIHSSNNNCSSPSKQQEYGHSNFILSAADLESHIAESCKMVSTLYAPFKSKAAEQVSRSRLILFMTIISASKQLFTVERERS